jgi:hypothetical protein
VDPSVPITVPPYLLCFAVPPVITTFVLSAIDPMAGMALLTCFVVMSLVLRCFLRIARPRPEDIRLEESGLWSPEAIALVDRDGRSPTP